MLYVNVESLIDEMKPYLEDFIFLGLTRGRQAARSHIERHMPAVVAARGSALINIARFESTGAGSRTSISTPSKEAGAMLCRRTFQILGVFTETCQE